MTLAHYVGFHTLMEGNDAFKPLREESADERGVVFRPLFHFLLIDITISINLCVNGLHTRINEIRNSYNVLQEVNTKKYSKSL